MSTGTDVVLGLVVLKTGSPGIPGRDAQPAIATETARRAARTSRGLNEDGGERGRYD